MIMEETNKKIEIWDEDRGWVYFCENCCRPSIEESEVCGFCGERFTKVERL